MRRIVKPILTSFFLLLLHQDIHAQHYFFVEAEGGQAYYMRIYDTLYSSTGEGFLIIPKVSDAKVAFTIGFPKGAYPEAHFELDGMNADRGFLLKYSNTGWILIDRQTQQQISSRQTVLPAVKDTIESRPAQANSDFANMLSQVTDDKSLLKEKPPVVQPKPVVSDSSVSVVSPIPPAQPAPKSIEPEKEIFVPSVVKTAESNVPGKLEIVYADKLTFGITDTIKLDIEIPEKKVKSDSVEHISMVKIGPSQKVEDCKQPAAEVKDIRTIQKKILGLVSEEEQLNYIEKAYRNKCFSVEQTKEIGWIFRDELVRLNLFKRIISLIADKTNIADLGIAFFKEDNIRAFKALIAQ